jgi:pimeloyl-ACP methyl ester carboxylesterase
VPAERRFELPGLTLAAQVWGEGLPVLAAHGWLDNSGSFDLLAPRLAGCEIVALDLAGHGRSGFRSPDSSYNLWQDVGDLLAVADALGWRRMTLLGHSRGAAISMLLAACFPERVDKLVLLEGGLPMTGEADEAPENMARALLGTRSLLGKTGRTFSDRAAAIAERAQGFTKISTEAAEVLARRSLVGVDGGFQWRADQRLKGPAELRFTADHVRAFVRRVEAPVLLVFAANSPFAGRQLYRETVELFPRIELRQLPGGHHFHLEGAEEAIAAAVRQFLGASP